MVMVDQTWGRGSNVIQISLSEITRLLPAVSYHSIRESIRRLKCPAVAVVRNGTQGHGILLADDFNHPSRQGRKYKIVEDWRVWGWPSDVSLDAISGVLDRHFAAPLPETWPAAAADLAGWLLRYVETVRGTDAELPKRSSDDLVWQRWCTCFAELLPHHHPETLRAILDWCFGPSLTRWGQRLCNGTPDKILRRHFPEILQHWRKSRHQTTWSFSDA